MGKVKAKFGVVLTVATLVSSWALLVPACGKTSRYPEPPARVRRALMNASRKWHVPYWQMRNVSWCESKFNPRVVNPKSGATGLLQFLPSTWAHTPYARRWIKAGWWNALGAAWLVKHDGDWHEWGCQP